MSYKCEVLKIERFEETQLLTLYNTLLVNKFVIEVSYGDDFEIGDIVLITIENMTE